MKKSMLQFYSLQSNILALTVSNLNMTSHYYHNKGVYHNKENTEWTTWFFFFFFFSITIITREYIGTVAYNSLQVSYWASSKRT